MYITTLRVNANKAAWGNAMTHAKLAAWLKILHARFSRYGGLKDCEAQKWDRPGIYHIQSSKDAAHLFRNRVMGTGGVFLGEWSATGSYAVGLYV